MQDDELLDFFKELSTYLRDNKSARDDILSNMSEETLTMFKNYCDNIRIMEILLSLRLYALQTIPELRKDFIDELIKKIDQRIAELERKEQKLALQKDQDDS